MSVIAGKGARVKGGGKITENHRDASHRGFASHLIRHGLNVRSPKTEIHQCGEETKIGFC